MHANLLWAIQEKENLHVEGTKKERIATSGNQFNICIAQVSKQTSNGFNILLILEVTK